MPPRRFDYLLIQLILDRDPLCINNPWRLTQRYQELTGDTDILVGSMKNILTRNQRDWTGVAWIPQGKGYRSEQRRERKEYADRS